MRTHHTGSGAFISAAGVPSPGVPMDETSDYGRLDELRAAYIGRLALIRRHVELLADRTMLHHMVNGAPGERAFKDLEDHVRALKATALAYRQAVQP